MLSSTTSMTSETDPEHSRPPKNRGEVSKQEQQKIAAESTETET